MKHALFLLMVFAAAVPSHAASRRCRTVTARANVHRVVASTNKHDNVRSNLVITAFAVPIAVPVAPFAPYWYGVAEYAHEPPSPSPRVSTTKPQASTINLHCGTCHGAISPKQGLSLTDLPALSTDERLRAIRAVVTGAMPPATESPLTDTDRTAILRELTE